MVRLGLRPDAAEYAVSHMTDELVAEVVRVHREHTTPKKNPHPYQHYDGCPCGQCSGVRDAVKSLKKEFGARFAKDQFKKNSASPVESRHCAICKSHLEDFDAGKWCNACTSYDRSLSRQSDLINKEIVQAFLVPPPIMGDYSQSAMWEEDTRHIVRNLRGETVMVLPKGASFVKIDQPPNDPSWAY